MIIYPAIDLYGGKAVRLYKGDYTQMTVYSDNPAEIARDFKAQGATHIHLVDLEGAKTGETPNLALIERLISETDLFAEVGGGIRSMDVIERYLSSGVRRVILGTAAVENPDFLEKAVGRYGSKVAVGVDLKDGYVAIKGWTEKSALTGEAFCERLQTLGVATVICTDISKDGAMQGANYGLYEKLSKSFPKLQFIASGGVSDLDGIRVLARTGLHGAIVGKAYYTKAITIKDAIGAAK